MWLREIFEHLGLQSFPKTSGSKGLQIYVPLNSPTSYESTKPFAHALARLLEDQHRDLVVSDMKKELRKGKVLVDWSQNDQHKTTIAVYSLRAREHPTVSTPVKWEEVEQLLKKKDASSARVRSRASRQARGEIGRSVRADAQAEAKAAEISRNPDKYIHGRGWAWEIAAQAELASNKPQASGEARRATRKPRQEEQQDITQSARLIFGPDFMAQLYVGTSGWAYPSWKPDFYPAKLAQKKFLQHYATQLNTVEVNFTFRQLVKETTTRSGSRRRPPVFALG